MSARKKEATRRCSSCLRTNLPERRFTKDASAPGGLSRTCAWCKALKSARRRAKRDGVPYHLSVSTLPWPYPVFCPLFPWIRLAVGSEDRGSSPSLDRIIPAKGYVDGNVRWISQRANELRRDASSRELRALGCEGEWLRFVEEAADEEE